MSNTMKRVFSLVLAVAMIASMALVLGSCKPEEPQKPVYADKYYKKAFRMGDLYNLENLYSKAESIAEWKNLTVASGYGDTPITADDIIGYLKEYGLPLLPHVCDTGVYLHNANLAGKKIMFEAQLGALRDIDFGIYPYTSSSNTIAGYAPVGAGVPGLKLDCVIGIMKAYSSCVGEGPFTCEMFGEEAEKLREAGGEYGAATGRPRRVGGFDAVASRYGVRMQGADVLALTKLDVLSCFDKIPVCVAYEVDGELVHDFPVGIALDKAKPVYEYYEGWGCDISDCRTFESLPAAAQAYVREMERLSGCRIGYVSVGAGREQYIVCE